MNPTVRVMAFFAALYFLQGAAFAYAVNYQKPFLLGLGVGKDQIGLFSSVLLLPFILKVLFGALSDRLPLSRWGRRKPFMILGLGLFTLGYGSLIAIDPAQNFTLFALLSFLASVGLALFDSAADGWAIDVAKPHEESAIQGAMVAGRSAGLVVMSLTFGWLASRFGFSSVFMVLAILALAVMVISLIFVKPQMSAADSGPKGLTALILDRRHALLAVYGIVYSVASFGTDGLWTLFLTETANMSLEGIGRFGVARGLGALLGAGLAGFVGVRLKAETTARIALLGLGAGCLLPLVPAESLARGALWGICFGFQETAFVTIAMILAKGPWSATLFAGAMIFSNVGTSIGEALAAPLSERIGYDPVFMIMATLAGVAILFVPKLKKN